MFAGNFGAAVLVACASIAALVTFAILLTVFIVVLEAGFVPDFPLYTFFHTSMFVAKATIYAGAIPALAIGAPLFYVIDRHLGMSLPMSIGLGLGLSVPFIIAYPGPIGLFCATGSVSIACLTWVYVMWWRRHPNSQTEAQLKVVKIALQKWDPLGVIPDLIEDGLPPDEYDLYVPSVLSNVLAAQDSREIAEYLAQLRVDALYLDASRPTEQEVELSIKLLEWKNAEFDNAPDFNFTKYTLKN